MPLAGWICPLDAEKIKASVGGPLRCARDAAALEDVKSPGRACCCGLANRHKCEAARAPAGHSCRIAKDIGNHDRAHQGLRVEVEDIDGVRRRALAGVILTGSCEDEGSAKR